MTSANFCNTFNFTMSKKNNMNINIKSSKKDTRSLTDAQKNYIASLKKFKCSNSPGSNLPGLEGYECPIWLKPDEKNPGSFDESGYQIDHKVEFSKTQDDSFENLQALCPCCHAVKTKLFMISKNQKTKVEINSEGLLFNASELTNKLPQLPKLPTIESESSSLNSSENCCHSCNGSGKSNYGSCLSCCCVNCGSSLLNVENVIQKTT